MLTVPESPCYLCQQRALGCHSKCTQYIAFARYRQAEAAERHRAVMQKVLLFRVMDVSLKRTLMQRIFRLGTMIVVSSDKTNPNLEVKNIKNVREFKEALNRRVESERLRMRFKAGEFIGSDFDDDNNDNT